MNPDSTTAIAIGKADSNIATEPIATTVTTLHFILHSRVLVYLLGFIAKDYFYSGIHWNTGNQS